MRTTEYSQMLEQAEPVERQLVYQKMREALVAFSAFMNTLDKTVGREAYRELFPDINYWLGDPSNL
ncbi:hypothetical protein HC891_01845 [Candidatus Gracilibacteria bacterium]|nr:hypothetical protein [Candidatus Gracilibacteria bacterium]